MQPMNPEAVRALADNVQSLIANYDKQKETYRELFALCYRHIADTRPAAWLSKEEREQRRQLLALLDQLTAKENPNESPTQPNQPPTEQ